MMKSILFDTDYLIEFLRGNPLYKEPIVKALNAKVAYISMLSIYELYAGMRPGEEEATENCIQAFHIEPLTFSICKNAGARRFNYRQRGITLGIVDCMIAATAQINNHLVATSNRKDYPGVQFIETN